MTLLRLVAIIVAILFAAPASAQPSPDNVAWAVTDQNQVFRGRADNSGSANFGWVNFEQVPGSLKQVSVGTGGEVWGVDPADNIHRWTGSQWQLVQGKLGQLSVRNAQEVWGVNAANDLFRWNGSAWEQIQIPGKFKRVSVGADGTVWAVDTLGRPLRRDGSTWTVVPSQYTFVSGSSPSTPVGNIALEQISVTDAQRVFGIGTISGDPSARPAARWTGTAWEIFSYRALDVAEAANGDRWELEYRTSELRGGENVLVERGLRLRNSKDNSWQSFALDRLAFKQIAVGSAAAVPPPPLPPELEAHNRERQIYRDVGPLQWSPELAQYAQTWAQTLANRDLRQGEHRQNYNDNPFRPGEWLGENIHSNSRSVPVAEAVQSWISEKQWYNYNTGCSAPQGYSCGHFTQVIWKATQYVGCGKATGASGWVYVVCNYYPSGNWNNQKPY
jgi:pathogenesis-related protein 1